MFKEKQTNDLFYITLHQTFVKVGFTDKVTGLWGFEGQMPYQKYQGPPIVVRLSLNNSGKFTGPSGMSTSNWVLWSTKSKSDFQLSSL